jgi:glycerol kinase
MALDTSAAHLARAALEAVAYQTLDLTEAMERDGAQPPAAIRIDGGMAANDWLCQFLADILQARIERPAELETTALGAAFLAGLASGVWADLDALSAHSRTAAVFEPRMQRARRATLLAGWRQALARALLPAR